MEYMGRFPQGSYIITEINSLQDKLTGKPGLQGELTWIDGGWYFYHAKTLGYMRKQLAISGEHAFGNDVLYILKKHLDPVCEEMIFDMFDRYIGDGQYPVIEFSQYPNNWGILKRRTIIWDIRNGF